MPANKISKIKPAELREIFKADLAICWQYARSLHPKDTPYAFALHGVEGVPHFYPYVLTEEGLTQVAKRYVAEGYHESVAAARKDIEAETRRSLDQIRREVADLTVLATEKVTRMSLDDADHKRLVEEALAEADFSALAAGSESNGGER